VQVTSVDPYSLSALIRSGESNWDESISLDEAPPLGDIFDEEPVSLDVFVKDKKYMGNPALGNIQYEAVRHIERVLYPHTYVQLAEECNSEYWARPTRIINFATLEWGKGGGKDLTCRAISLRVAYILSCLKSPQQYFGMPDQDTIHLLNIASSAPQAYQAFFAPITRVVRRGWFVDHCDPKMNAISYKKNIEVISGNSDAESQEGLNLILGVADEIDAFKSKDELEKYRGKSVREPTRSAEAILKLLRTSSVTRFPETFKVVRISYPRYVGSMIQKLNAQGRADNERRGESSRHYVSGPHLTWVVNPLYAKYPLVHIPQTEELVPDVASIIEDYEEDPAMAKAMYECKPSRATDTYFKNMDAVRNCVIGEQPITFFYETETFRSPVTGSATVVWKPKYEFNSEFKPIEGARYCLHADMSLKNDRAGFAMSHVINWEEVTEVTTGADGEEIPATYLRPIVKNDFAITWEASLRTDPSREIQVKWARDLIFMLIKMGFSIAYVSYDGFASEESIQILNSHGIETECVSMDKTDMPWKELRDLMYNSRLTVPYSQLLLDELEALGRQPNGKIDHPLFGSKDAADALAGSVRGAILQGGAESTDKEIAYYGNSDIDTGSIGLELDDIPLEYGLSMPIGFQESYLLNNPMSNGRSRMV
jgi:hypothetical protein